MSFKDDNDKPPTSKDEAWARRVRPSPEKYDPDKRSRWSITMTVAWIIRRDLDAVRNQCDSYREKCADWRFERDPRARALADRIAIDKITGQIAPSDPDLQKKIQEKLQEGSWHRRSWKPSGWNTLPASEHIRPQVAIEELWQAAGEGKIKATAIEYKNAKALLGDQIDIPAHYWARLKHTDDPSTGKAMLYDDQGRVYRDVKFPRLDVKELWPKSPPSSGERLEHVEKPEPEQTSPAEPERLEKKAWLAWALKEYPKLRNERGHIRRLHGLMEKADNVTAPWKYETFRIRYYDAVKAERQAVQKERKSPRTV